VRIFLIDDDMTVVQNLTLFLQADFHAVSWLTFVPDRCLLIEAMEDFEPDGVVLDYGMERTGTEICDWIHGWKPEMPIVFYTSYAGSAHEREQMLRKVSEDCIIAKRETGADVDTILATVRSLQ